MAAVGRFRKKKKKATCFVRKSPHLATTRKPANKTADAGFLVMHKYRFMWDFPLTFAMYHLKIWVLYAIL